MNATTKEHVAIIGVPMDLGADRRGVDMGPSAIRYAGLQKRLQNLGYTINDNDDLVVQKQDCCSLTEDNLKYLEEIEMVNIELCHKVAEEMAKGYFPLVLGGDHSIAIGTIAGVLQHKKRLGVLWFDAHADINTQETSPSGNIHGMSLAVSLGIGHKRLTDIGGEEHYITPDKLVMIGIRNLDPGEKIRIKELGITVYTMHEIDTMGIAQVMQEALEIVSQDTDGVHVSFDMDVMDPLHAPGVGTPVFGGLTYRESRLAMEMIADAGLANSAEFVEVNTILDNKNQTAKVAVDLIGALLGERLK